MKPFTERAIEIIKQIPPGKVMTYGQVAKLAGSPRGARQVVRILHSMTKKYQLPWHRVINSQGKISVLGDELYSLQVLSLQSEGVVISDEGFVDLERFRYHPTAFYEPF